jgi:glycyl-tRNA synthetase beta chain
MERLARWIASDVFARQDQAAAAGTAARLSKADLTTDMVFEFPELQGTMGGIYAREEGQPEAVWNAVYHHYLPTAVEADAPPRMEDLGEAAITWAAVSLADKLDTVVGLLHVGERPTGSRDPFGIRRQLQGVVRILLDLETLSGLGQEIGLRPLCAKAAAAFGADAPAEFLEGFLQERVRFVLEERGYPLETVRAVTQDPYVSPLRARRIADALQDVRRSEDFLALAVLFKRVKNIARELPHRQALDRARLVEPAERSLLDGLDAQRPVVERAVASGDYRRAFTEIAALRPAVDRFFTEVFVMVDEAALRAARLTLMAELRDLVLQLADISEIAPQSE